MLQFSDNSCSVGASKTPTNLSQRMGTSARVFFQSDSYRVSNDASLFSSSLPVLAHEKSNFTELKHDAQFVDDSSPSLIGLCPDSEGKKLLEEGENHEVGRFLPDDEDELLAGMIDGYDVSWLPNLVDDVEECDVFGSGGGLELESDSQDSLRVGVSKLSLFDDGVANGVAHVNLTNGVGTIAGEHPLGEHPSRTLFVRNINSNVEDAELRALFEQYGDIRTMYTTCKHRGFVMISYYDIRAARTAMRSLQNKSLRRRKLDIHFSIPKENPSDKDINQGTLVVFNLDPSVSNDDLQHIFGAYGEVKEIRETPHKRHHKFIEFYDVRAAEAALKSLNRSDIAGKRIKLEPSRPGGARRSLLLHLNQELEQDERNLHRVGSPLENSPPGNWPQLGSPMERNSLQNFSKSPVFSSFSPPVGNSLPGLASVRQSQVPNQRVTPTGKDLLRGPHLEHIFSNENSNCRGIFDQSHSFPEQKLSPYSGPVSSFGASAFNTPRAQTMRFPFMHGGNSGFPIPNLHGSFCSSSQLQQQRHQYHIGSAPSGVPLERQFGYFQESSKASLKSPSFDGVAPIYKDRSFTGNMVSPRLSPVFLGNGHFPGVAVSNMEGLAERGKSRRIESNGTQIDNKKQFQLDLDKIRSGEDTRTTLMIKNIPNKYTSKMLLATIDEHHQGTYDFLYLPIDFKNKCNVGYAFINMLSPLNIIPFYEAFNGKKWEKFNSEKVASLAFARIQGKAALVAHFQNSSLMNEDKRCRPILLDSESPELNNKLIKENPAAGQSNGEENNTSFVNER
ncbi:protein MEI2-like 5 isoform X1 [Sesamum indicum]|uniref:protein MEI2-like 5 isoform X1 n=1 Tax=Sesamum indicum TaxID=4182 RepID=A0A6I9U6W9_SESIN|nr:protein MEI2-like 5 isoform X1 [Sesamum indicum]XP_011096480.1 protein MEI2-like 5 isoform X1 [Sesamum indicum]XP_011096481.1 protein MEI2-like 5 isoform X1 [Sesamum indicum]XP_011096482.1 protein MEI2-like 5 isoform X1 [Sesamum indicum]XP_020554117.1 protein MEI2-like 5 isoform X1 [Sesamum indicum]XP_020554118.1 protein MEI2-like 5 isoform X1 [Sesamum indicum]